MSLATLDLQSTTELESNVGRYLRQADPRLAKISVSANELAVKLEGTVDSYYLRALAINAANRVAGVHVIDDQIAVQSNRN
jgi:osmotically-inducible protein OsmY